MNNRPKQLSPNRDIEVELPPRKASPTASTAWFDTEESGPIDVLPSSIAATPVEALEPSAPIKSLEPSAPAESLESPTPAESLEPSAPAVQNDQASPLDALLTGDTDEMEIPIFADASELFGGDQDVRNDDATPGEIASDDAAARADTVDAGELEPAAAGDTWRGFVPIGRPEFDAAPRLEQAADDSGAWAGDAWLAAAARGATSDPTPVATVHHEAVAVPRNGPSTSRTALLVTAGTIAATLLVIWIAVGSLEGASPAPAGALAAGDLGLITGDNAADPDRADIDEATVRDTAVALAGAVVGAASTDNAPSSSAPTVGAPPAGKAGVEARQAPAPRRHAAYAGLAPATDDSATEIARPAPRGAETAMIGPPLPPDYDATAAEAPLAEAAADDDDHDNDDGDSALDDIGASTIDAPALSADDIAALDEPLVRRTGELSAEVIVPFRGKARDAVAYKLRDGRSAAVNFPEGISTLATRDYAINRDGVVYIWIRERQSGGTHVRVIGGTRVRENRIVVARDHLRFELDFRE